MQFRSKAITKVRFELTGTIKEASDFIDRCRLYKRNRVVLVNWSNTSKFVEFKVPTSNYLEEQTKLVEFVKQCGLTKEY